MRLLPAAITLVILTGASASIPAQDTIHQAPMEVTRGKPYVMVTVNGKGPFRFLIDTGTGGEAIVTPELASILQLPETGKIILNDPTGLGGQEAPLRTIDTLEVAGVEFYALKAAEHALLASDGSCDGILGFPLFRGLLLTLDYPGRRLVLADGELDADGDTSVQPFRLKDSVPIADLTIGDLHVDALLDSGGAGLSLPERLIPQLAFTSAPKLFGRAHSLSTLFDVKVAKLATDVQLGDIALDQPWIEINPAFPLANFGAVPMQHFVVTFDQDNQLVRFDGPHKRITLGVTPTPVHLTDQPSPDPVDRALVPIG